MSTISKYTELVKDNDLNEHDTSAAFNIIMDGKSELDDLILFLETLNNNVINQNHVLGAVNIMRKKRISVDIQVESIDTCGTGGAGTVAVNI